MEELARQFATLAHEKVGQRRKYTGEPYIVHPAEVVDLVRMVPHTEAMICAGWLHDVVEDTSVTLCELERIFDKEVVMLVEMLTDVSTPQDGNRAARKALDRAHLAAASREAKTIKLADLISNSKSILQHDPAFARVYLEEKRLLLEVLKDGDSTLWHMAHAIVKNAR